MEKIFEAESVKNLILNEELHETPVFHLFGNYFLQNEICCVFGDSNTGKTILCNDIALSISGGKCWWPEKMSDVLEIVLNFDYELSKLQVARRYLGSSKFIPDTYERVELNKTSLAVGEELFDAMVNYIMGSQAKPNPPKVIIIDNLTYLMNSVTSAAHSLRIMKELKKLKNAYNLSFILVAHCPKRKKDRPITQDDLGGSKMIMNFCDSAIAIGTSIWDEDTRYIKHIKARGVEKKTKVDTIELQREPYLHFEYVGENDESEHLSLKLTQSSLTPDEEAEIIELREDYEMSIREIANKLGLSKSVVGRFVKNMGL